MQKAKVASLKVEAELLQKTREAEMNAEMLKLQYKIAKAEAKATVLENIENRCISSKDKPTENN